jgi:hypothetical protein
MLNDSELACDLASFAEIFAYSVNFFLDQFSLDKETFLSAMSRYVTEFSLHTVIMLMYYLCLVTCTT